MFSQLVARNRNLSVEAIKNTEAGLYFGQNAVEIGLADGVTIFSEFINKGDKTMTEQLKAEQPREQATSEDLIAKYKKYQAEVLEIARLCNLSKMPERVC